MRRRSENESRVDVAVRMYNESFEEVGDRAIMGRRDRSQHQQSI